MMSRNRPKREKTIPDFPDLTPAGRVDWLRRLCDHQRGIQAFLDAPQWCSSGDLRLVLAQRLEVTELIDEMKGCAI